MTLTVRINTAAGEPIAVTFRIDEDCEKNLPKPGHYLAFARDETSAVAFRRVNAFRIEEVGILLDVSPEMPRPRPEDDLVFVLFLPEERRTSTTYPSVEQ